MYFKTFYKSQKEQIAGCISLEVEDEIRLGRDACHCVCNCTCACACFCVCFSQALDVNESNPVKINYSTEEYLTRVLQS